MNNTPKSTWAAWGVPPKVEHPQKAARFAVQAALPETERRLYGFDDTGRRRSDYPFGGENARGQGRNR